MRPLLTLEDMGLEYELETTPFMPRYLHKEYLAVDPLGAVPAFVSAEAAGHDRVDNRSGDPHAKLGGYPPNPGENHRMRSCCKVMCATMGGDDDVLWSPPNGQGASLTIRYRIPR